jgi:RHS repeat-associated protein
MMCRYRVHNAEGYVNRLEVYRPRVTATNTYNYYRRDHLGNNCAVWDATNDTTLQQTVYYASGLPLSVSSGQSVQPYKYNGKEFIEMHGYDTYDYGWRGYYAAVGRFTTIDPLAEKYYGISPYVYCAGNPIMFIDPDGRQITGGIPSKQKKDGVWTTAQSTTYRPIPEKKEPVKMTESKKEQIRRDEQAKRQGTIDSKDQINYRRTQNEAMNNPVTKQCLTDPVLQSAAVGGLTVAAVATSPATVNVTKQIAKEKVLPILYKGAQIALQNPTVTEIAVGASIGVGLSLLSDKMQDVPQFTTGISTIDNSSSVAQFFITVGEFVDYINSGGVQTPVGSKDDQDEEK